MHEIAWRDADTDRGPARCVEAAAVGDRADHEPLPPRPGRRRAEPGAVRRAGPPDLGTVRDAPAARADRLHGRRRRAQPQRHHPAAGPHGTRRAHHPDSQHHRPPPLRRLPPPARAPPVRAGLARARRRDRPLFRPAPDRPRYRRPGQDPRHPDPGQPEPPPAPLTPAPHRAAAGSPAPAAPAVPRPPLITPARWPPAYSYAAAPETDIRTCRRSCVSLGWRRLLRNSSAAVTTH